MPSRLIAACVALALTAAPVLAAAKPEVAEDWVRPGWERRPFHNVVVVVITDDAAARKNLENKLVSHLRGRGIEAATSYGIAPDLTALPSREQVAEFVEGQGLDGAISVRLVPLESPGEAEWAAAWVAGASSDKPLRELIEESLPVAAVRAERYGVEISLWDTRERLRLWSGRTGTHGIKQLRKGAADLVQSLIDVLKLERLL